jgi:GABA permease
VRNPFRDEGAAFRLVFLTIGAFGLIAVGSWISTWLGAAVAIVLAAVGVWVVWTGRRERPDRLRPALPDRHRILVVANETVEGNELLAEIRRAAAAGSAEVYVVCPALNSKLRTWTSDEDAARDAAQARLDRSLARLEGVGLTAAGEVGDADPVQAVEDALRVFGADAIVLSTHPEGRSHWLERGVVDAVRQRFVVPVTHIVVDLERQG